MQHGSVLFCIGSPLNRMLVQLCRKPIDSASGFCHKKRDILFFSPHPVLSPFQINFATICNRQLNFFSNDFSFLFISKLSLLPAFLMPYKLSLSSEHGEMSLGALNPHRWTKGKTLKTFVDAQLFLKLT